uniref:Major capsid protein N-terminal domain-containing protein n=1 Tax=viral metagenome TaxID=1070528 RepID=A0A6C0AMB2_9ZZZZ
MDRPATSAEGSLIELVARGNKDVYFMSNDKSAHVPFSYTMKTWPATIDETRQTQPLNMIDFGRTVEWEMEIFGDILIAAALVVELPTWLPPSIAALNYKNIISDTSNQTYGYTQGIGAFLFEQIQFYQDQLLLQEFSGDFLYAWYHLQSSLSQEALALKEMGCHSGSALDIQRNANPKKLTLRLPLIGCAHPDEGGFPFVSLPGQKFRIRCKLRRLEDLVESSSQLAKPAPWSRSDLNLTDVSGNQTGFQALTREQIGKPLVTLETTQRYVRQDLQALLKKNSFQIPFLRPFENKLSLDPSDYVAVGNGGASYVTKRIDGRHPAESLLIFFQSEYNIERNQLWNLKNPLGSGEYYNTMQLLIAAKEREKSWDNNLWERISPWTKAEKTPGIPISWISFTVGPQYGSKAPEMRKPSGTVNFTSADKPTLWMDITDTLPTRLGQKRVTMRSVTIGWGIYNIEDQRGALMFGN